MRTNPAKHAEMTKCKMENASKVMPEGLAKLGGLVFPVLPVFSKMWALDVQH